MERNYLACLTWSIGGLTFVYAMDKQSADKVPMPHHFSDE